MRLSKCYGFASIFHWWFARCKPFVCWLGIEAEYSHGTFSFAITWFRAFIKWNWCRNHYCYCLAAFQRFFTPSIKPCSLEKHSHFFAFSSSQWLEGNMSFWKEKLNFHILFIEAELNIEIRAYLVREHIFWFLTFCFIQSGQLQLLYCLDEVKRLCGSNRVQTKFPFLSFLWNLLNRKRRNNL